MNLLPATEGAPGSASPRLRRFLNINIHDGSILSWICKIQVFFLYIGGQITVAAIIFYLPWMSLYVLGCFSLIAFYFILRFICGSWTALRSLNCDEPRDWDEVPKDGPTHFVVFPNYMENESVLRDSLQCIARSPMAGSIVVVLAMEAKEGTQLESKVRNLTQSFKDSFADVVVTYHPDGVVGEIPGKASNEQYAYRVLVDKCWKSGISLDNVVLTIVDADVLVDPMYFNAISCDWARKTREQRHWIVWTCAQLQIRNFWSCPAVCRVVQIPFMLYDMAGLHGWWNQDQPVCSTYSIPLSLLDQLDGWSAHTIAEDNHIYSKALLANLYVRQECKLKSEVVPVQLSLVRFPMVFFSYMPESSNWFMTLHAKFKQAVRHGYGNQELIYIIRQWFHLVKCFHVRFIFSWEHIRLVGLLIEMLSQVLPAVYYFISAVLCMGVLLYYYGMHGLLFPCNTMFPEAQCRSFVVFCRLSQVVPVLYGSLGFAMAGVIVFALNQHQKFMDTRGPQTKYWTMKLSKKPADSYLVFFQVSLEFMCFFIPAGFFFGYVPLTWSGVTALSPDLSKLSVERAEKPDTEESPL